MKIGIHDIPTEGSMQLFASEFSKSSSKPPKERPKYEKYIAPLILVFIPVFGNLFLYLTINYVIEPWVKLQSGLGITICAAGLFFYVNSMISLVRALLSDPGAIPEGWKLWDGSPGNHPPIPYYAKMNQTWLNTLANQLQTAGKIKTVDHSNKEESDRWLEKQNATGNGVIMLMSTDDAKERFKDVNWISVGGKNRNQEKDDNPPPKKTVSRPPQSEEEFKRLMGNVKFPFGITPSWEHVQYPSGTYAREKIKKKNVISNRSNNTAFFPPGNFKQPVPSQWCKVCLLFKPPRSHHCSRCKRCVAKMDHHCIFLGKCVGKDNYKPFYLFLFHTTVGLIYCEIVLAIRFITGEFSIISYESACLFFLITSSSYIIYLVGSMLLYHTTMVTGNKTQIEQIFDQPAVQDRFSKESHFANAQVVMGKYPITWLFPI